MKRRSFLSTAASAGVLTLTGCGSAPDPLPVVSVGRVERLDTIVSRHVPARPVDVWLPPNYDGRTRHPVIYMHDGQALFDGAAAMSKTGWHVDAAVERLLKQGLSPAPVLVCIWSHKTQRHSEYFPQPMLDQLPREARERAWEQVPLLMRPFAGELVREGKGRSEAYLKFIVDELKPVVDARFVTQPGRESTFLMGSSMGGLISLYGLLSHPQVFGAAASLSTHWVGLFERNDEISDAALAWLRSTLPAPSSPLRLYLDRGTAEMDAAYAHAQAQVDALLVQRGFASPQVVSRVFEGAGHNERDWGARVHLPLTFLLQGST